MHTMSEAACNALKRAKKTFVYSRSTSVEVMQVQSALLPPAGQRTQSTQHDSTRFCWISCFYLTQTKNKSETTTVYIINKKT